MRALYEQRVALMSGPTAGGVGGRLERANKEGTAAVSVQVQRRLYSILRVRL